jgi:hypothetical protein
MVKILNKNKINNFLPFLSWVKELKNPKILKSDIIA